MHYIGVRDGDRENGEKKAKIITIILNFFYTIYLAIHKADTKLKTLAQIETDISVIEFFVKEKKNGQIKKMISTMC